jgi:F-type H+-transporting ATPase subunit gamma
MASLKAIRKRIVSVRNTQQITKAMKMVAAAKLRRAQEAVVQSRAYAEKLGEVWRAWRRKVCGTPLVRARTPRRVQLFSSPDRSLCGGFNESHPRARRFSPPSSAPASVVGRKG